MPRPRLTYIVIALSAIAAPAAALAQSHGCGHYCDLRPCNGAICVAAPSTAPLSLVEIRRAELARR